MNLYDTLPTAKSIPTFNPSVHSLSLPLKSGPTTPVIHNAESISSTTSTGIPIHDPYKEIPANPVYEGKLRSPCH